MTNQVQVLTKEFDLTNAKPQIEKSALSVKEVSERFDWSQKTTRRLIWDRKVDHFRIGNRVFIPVASLESYIASQTVSAVNAAQIARDVLSK